MFAKLSPALILSILLATPAAFAADAPTLYSALQVKPQELCHNTESCPGQYVQVKEVGGLRCTYTIFSEAMSPVKLECRLSRGNHENIFNALKGDRSSSRKSVGGLICERDRSLWGGGDTRCALR